MALSKNKIKQRQLGMPKPNAEEWIRQLQQSKYLAKEIDSYNQGELVQELEQRVANLLGKPAALFFGKGMAAQFAALKASEEISQCSNIALHPLSHLAYDEADSYQHLLQLNGNLLGKDNAPFNINDVQSIHDQISTLTVELPLRRAGFKLTAWDELLKMSDWCHQNNVHFHLDGARIWESTHFYQKTEAEISALFDTVYVSLYKGLGSMGGALLAGGSDFIESCKVWRSRLAGNSFTLFPMVIGAMDGLDKRHSTMHELVERAQQIAELLSEFPQLKIDRPHTNGFIIFLDGDVELLNKKAQELNADMGLQLFYQVTQFPHSDQTMIELQVGAEHQAISDEEILSYFTQLLNT